MSVNDLITEGIRLFESNKIDEAIVKFNQALNEIEDKRAFLQEQNNIQFWLGCCYFEQARKVRDITGRGYLPKLLSTTKSTLNLPNS